MFLFAIDEKENLVPAYEAHKQKDYFCRECGGIVRCRGGFFRQLHYYHLESDRICRQSGKSLTHLQIQLFILNAIPMCELEKRFPLINRIADAVWQEKKLVFEIQCSPITAREIEERNNDYQSLGYQIIWILHDQLYNKTRLTAAEFFLQKSPHYFTNMNSEGLGYIYDQCDHIENGKRLKTISIRKIKIDSYHPCKEEQFPKIRYPKWFIKRILQWPIYFSGDFIDYFLKAKSEEQISFFSASNEDEISDGLETWPILWIKKCFNIIMLPYRLTMHLIVEMLTR